MLPFIDNVDLSHCALQALCFSPIRSGIIAWQYKLRLNYVGKLYVLLVSALCCFSEVTPWWVFCNIRKLRDPFAVRLISLLWLPRGLNCVAECWPGLAFYNRTVDSSVFIAWTPSNSFWMCRSSAPKLCKSSTLHGSQDRAVLLIPSRKASYLVETSVLSGRHQK